MTVVVLEMLKFEFSTAKIFLAAPLQKQKVNKILKFHKKS
jgi:hypothetical protein